jgi:hypothetical protein
MGINSINSPGASGITPDINAGEVKKGENSIFSKIAAGSPGSNKPDFSTGGNVREHAIGELSLAETSKATNVEEVQNTAETKETSGGGMFRGFKIGAGESSGPVKGMGNNGGNVKSRSLDDRT